MTVRALEDGSHVTHQALDHVGLTVADIDAVTAVFVALVLEVEGRTFVEGEFLDTRYSRLPRRDRHAEVARRWRPPVTVADVRALARTLPRSSEHLVHDRVKFRVGAIVYVAFSRDETTMGFGYPREERAALVASDPDLFFLPGESDLRFNWVCCHLARLDPGYMTELVTDAWRMVVPKFLARQRLGG